MRIIKIIKLIKYKKSNEFYREMKYENIRVLVINL